MLGPPRRRRSRHRRQDHRSPSWPRYRPCCTPSCTPSRRWPGRRSWSVVRSLDFRPYRQRSSVAGCALVCAWSRSDVVGRFLSHRPSIRPHDLATERSPDVKTVSNLRVPRAILIRAGAWTACNTAGATERRSVMRRRSACNLDLATDTDQRLGRMDRVAGHQRPRRWARRGAETSTRVRDSVASSRHLGDGTKAG